MTNNLKEITTSELILELKSRGFTTDLLFCLEDVDTQINNINFDVDDDKKVELDDLEKLDILDTLSFDYFISRINEEIFDKVHEHRK
jgi:hypothetical protein